MTKKRGEGNGGEMRIPMSARETKLRKQADKIRKEVMRLKASRKQQEHKKLVGKFFRYRNSYSCPEGDKDKWWKYFRVSSIDGGTVYADTFQLDKDGRAEAEFGRPFMGVFFESCDEITEGFFYQNKDGFLHYINKRLQEAQ